MKIKLQRQSCLVFLAMGLTVIGSCIILQLCCEAGKSNNPIASDNFRQNVNLNLYSKDMLQIDDFQIACIKLGDSISVSSKLLGKPKKVISNDEEKIYKFQGFEVRFFRETGEIVHILVEREGLNTYRGISIGDREEEVLHRYGATKKLGGNTLHYNKLFQTKDSNVDFACALDFIVENGKVNKIRIYYAGN